MNYKLKIIKTESDYTLAQSQLTQFISEYENKKHNKEFLDEFELLSYLIDKYEKKKFDFGKVDFISAIKFQMEQLELTRKDLEPILGASSRVSEILSGKKSLTKSMIKRLHEHLFIPYEILMSEPASTRDNLAIDVSTYPLKEMLNRGIFEGYKTATATFKKNAEKLIHDYLSEFGQTPKVFCRSSVNSTHMRSVKEMNEINLQVWKCEVLKKAKNNKLVKTSFNKKCLSLDFMNEILKLSKFRNGPLLAQEELARNGIHLIYEPHFSKTYLDGAAMKGLDENPIIGITGRYDRLDNFWFVLMHELAHVWKHLDADRSDIFDDLESAENDDIEIEADSLALDALMDQDEWKNTVYPEIEDADDLAHFANRYSVDASIIAGRYRKESGDYRKFNRWIGSKRVRILFEK
ncbi:ImmA/IrrE family metallo-endopeptidase [Catenovulum agarivorans]|uniref:ImmA/IrrE family metallo-endopeptidase n=1 Tax=Catenovulum agarivorans TaxID=1172192 RepID=UPI0002ECA44F|nr:ImmA/IrrE family metallo-endopeptidase [Catenovulum agarivorans]